MRRLPEVLRVFWLPILVAGVILLAGGIRASGDTVDDACISFRCVENLVRGDGLSFNPGTRVESFSNPLQVFLLIPAARSGFPLDRTAQLIGLMSFLLCIAGAADLVRRAGAKTLFVVAAGCGTAMSFPLLYYSVTGLETGLFACLLLCAVWRHVCQQRLDVPGAFLWIGVAYCRPEGVAYVVAFLSLILWKERRRPGHTVAMAALVVAGVGLGLVARHSYYDLWLPNSFYAKPPGTADLVPWTGALHASALYLLRYVLGVGVLVPFLGAYFVVRHRRADVAMPLAAVVCVGVAFSFYTGGDWFPAGRYLQPVTPALMVLAALGAEALAERFPRAARPRLFAAALLLSVAGASLFTLGEFIALRTRYPYHVMNGRDNTTAARWMKENLAPGIRIAAFRIGAVGYVSGHEIVDLFGLADHRIARILARHPGFHPRAHLGNDLPELREYVASLRPGAALRVNNAGEATAPLLDLYGGRYRFVRKFPLGSDQEFVLYLREDG